MDGLIQSGVNNVIEPSRLEKRSITTTVCAAATPYFRISMFRARTPFAFRQVDTHIFLGHVAGNSSLRHRLHVAVTSEINSKQFEHFTFLRLGSLDACHALIYQSTVWTIV